MAAHLFPLGQPALAAKTVRSAQPAVPIKACPGCWRPVAGGDTWREEIEFQPAKVHLPLGLRLAAALKRRAGDEYPQIL
jgi:hypothetical protein